MKHHPMTTTNYLMTTTNYLMTTTNSWQSWNQNLHHTYKKHIAPASESEIVDFVKSTEGTIRMYGAKMSSADIAAGAENLISSENYNNVLACDDEKRRITVQSGISLKKLIAAMAKKGWCLPSLPDVDTITLGGAISTGTHGTGKNAGLLSEMMVACRLIKANGDVIIIDQQSGMLDAVRTSLGLLGILSTITIACVPTFQMVLEEGPMPDHLWLAKLNTLQKKNDFLRILWLPHTNYGYVIQGTHLKADHHRHPTQMAEQTLATVSPSAPWYHKYRRAVSYRLYRFTVNHNWFTRIANTIIFWFFFRRTQKKRGTLYDATVTQSRSHTMELAEWTIPMAKFPATFDHLRQELNKPGNRAYAQIPMDIRFIKRDNTWLSYAYGSDTVTVGCITRCAEAASTYKAFEVIESVFITNGGRPHWAKRHHVDAPTLRQIYPKWDAFITLRKKMDPQGRYLTGYLARLFA